MFKAVVATTLLTGVGLFGYFYFTDRSDASAAEKARRAAGHVGNVVVDQGIAAGVSALLKANLGTGQARFLHVFNDDGRVVVYGMADAGLSDEAIAEIAAKFPGVKKVDVRLVQLPDSLQSAAPRNGEAGDGG